LSTLITNIGELVTNAPAADPGPGGGPGAFAAITGAAVVIDGGRVAWTGPAARAPAADEIVDAGGRAVLPGFVDSHAHLVFAGERGGEFAARMAGQRYEAGGIRATVAATRAASDATLRAGLRRLADEMLRQGTTTYECKSGYGLTVRDEARSLMLAAEVTPEVTYLGAHVVPPEFEGDAAGYLDLVCGPMLEACAPHAKWIDVFCERGAFGADEAAAVLAAGRARGLLPRVHANQLGPGPGVRVAVEAGAASADHCTYLTDADVDALASSGTVATLLPGVEFSTRQPYPDARRLLGAGVTVALATDCNPGSCFTSSMALCIALAVREMRMTTQEAVWSATAGGARALRRTDVGHLGVGARADLVMLDAPSHAYLAYRPGVPLAAAVWREGRLAHALPQFLARLPAARPSTMSCTCPRWSLSAASRSMGLPLPTSRWHGRAAHAVRTRCGFAWPPAGKGRPRARGHRRGR
jgi:imidazolonepropionase